MRQTRLHWLLLVCLLASPAGPGVSCALTREMGLARVLAELHGGPQAARRSAEAVGGLDADPAGAASSPARTVRSGAARALPLAAHDFAAQPAGP